MGVRSPCIKPAVAAEILSTAGKQIAASTPHTRGAVTMKKANTGNQAIDWKFKDENGRPWSGKASVEPSPEDKLKNILSLKVARLT